MNEETANPDAADDAGLDDASVEERFLRIVRGDKDEPPAKKAKSVKPQPTADEPAPDQSSQVPPKSVAEDDEAEEPEVKKPRKAKAAKPAPEPEPEEDEAPSVETIDDLAKAFDVEPDELMSRVMFDHEAGRTSLADVAKAWRAAPLAQAELEQTRQLRADYSARYNELQTRAEPYINHLKTLGIALYSELQLEQSSLEKLKQQLTSREIEPEEYVKQMDANTRRARLMQEVQGQLEAERSRRAAEEHRLLQEYRNDEARKLTAKMPELANPEKAKAFTQQITSYLKDTFGFSEAEANSIPDHRHVLLIRKAMQFDEFQKKAAEGRKKRTDVKPTLKLRPSGPPARGAQGDAQAERRSKAFDRFRKTGKPEHGLAVFEELVRRK